MIVKKFHSNIRIYYFNKIIDELSGFKHFFGAQEIVLAFDNSKGGYWRKRIYDRYKYGRAEGRDTSEIQWGEAFSAFNELREIFDKASSYKTLSIPSVEGDDIIFVLSKYFSDNGDKTVIHSLDHDLEYCLEYRNVEYFKTRKTQRLHGLYVERTKEELDILREQHKFIGDKGDGFGHIKWWTQFGPEFLKEFPKFKGKEFELYHKHHEIEKMYQMKMDAAGTPKIKAYKQPRFGWKNFIKSKKTIKQVLDENKIHKLNYEMNKKLALPEEIPDDIIQDIIYSYENAPNKRNNKELLEFINENKIFEISNKLPLL